MPQSDSGEERLPGGIPAIVPGEDWPDSSKCAGCSGPISSGELVVFSHGELFHVRCWHVMGSEERSRHSRSEERSRQSHALIRKSRRTIDETIERLKQQLPKID
jgi:hypothetical protein